MRDYKLVMSAFAIALLLIEHYHCEAVVKPRSEEERNIQDSIMENGERGPEEEYNNDEMNIRTKGALSSDQYSRLESHLDEEGNQVAVKEKRGGGLILIPLIAAAITVGATLAGATIASLASAGYSVTASGSIENYSKWTMFMKHCTPKSGYMNHPMVTVAPGMKEGFASHKANWAHKGTWVYCNYRVNGKYVHIMYSIPFSHIWHSNWMALAISSSNDKKWNAYNMYWYDYTGMDKKKYYRKIVPTKVCRYGICIEGTMGNNYKSIIKIKLYPQSYYNLAPKVTKELENKDHIPHYKAVREYSAFIREIFH